MAEGRGGMGLSSTRSNGTTLKIGLVVFSIGVGATLHYANKLFPFFLPDFLPRWLFDHSVHDPFLILPVAYASWAFSLTGGMSSLGISIGLLALLLPFEANREARNSLVLHLGTTIVTAAVAVVAVARWARERAGHLQDQALLKASHEKYHGVVEHNSEAILLATTGSSLLEANSMASELFGYSKYEFVGMPVSRLIVPNGSGDAFRQALLYSRFQQNVQCARKDGTHFPGSLTVTIADLGSERVAIGIIRDLTVAHRLAAEVKAREKALEDATTKYRALVEHNSEAIFLVDETGHYLEMNPKACQMTGYSREELMGRHVSLLTRADDPPQALGRALSEGTAERDSMFVRRDGSEFPGHISISVFPLDGQRVALGVLRDTTEEHLLEQERQNNERILREGYLQQLETLHMALAARDPYTHGHAGRVRDYAVAVARRLGLTDQQIHLLAQAAEFHDYGKIGVSDTVLLKPGPLAPWEMADMMRHPQIGATLISHIPFLQDVVPIILAHHEKMDGSGYPRGLQGEEIPTEARIIGVVDAYDALISNRPYRSALSQQEAVEILKRESGGKWDPRVVEVFLELLSAELVGQPN